MTRRGMHVPDGEAETGHSSRPWVYFMIDAFFLCTQFFVVTFHVAVDERVLPQQLPPGCIPRTPTPNPPPRPIDRTEKLRVHVSRANGAPVYEYGSVRRTLAELNQALTDAAVAGKTYTVHVSYDAGVPFGDVMAVFNACARLHIQRCGLVPLYRSQAAPEG
ncbi:MAG: biopolymer transporter ExbD [Planctomycetota bacterium]|nr:biopolymer transporter ExbD [Planctomycetota bacterium]